MIKRITRFVSIGFAVMLCAIMGYYYSCSDISAPDISDLTLTRPVVADSDNAYTYFEVATNVLYWPDEVQQKIRQIGESTEISQDEKDLIAKNKQMFKKLKKGLSCRICQAPEVIGYDTPLPYIRNWLHMEKIMALKVRSERLAGHCNRATDSCVSLLRFTHLIQADTGSLIGYLVSLAALNQGLLQARNIARDSNVSKKNLQQLSQALGDIDSINHGLICAMKSEHKLVDNTINNFISGKYGYDELIPWSISSKADWLRGRRLPPYVFQPNKTKLTFADLYREMINNVPLFYSEINLTRTAETLDILEESKIKLLVKPNAIGRILYGMLIPALDRTLQRKCETEGNMLATQLIILMNLYKKNEGSFPEKLEDLVPEYIAVLPNDPFDGKPLRYSRLKGIVYSVGEDLKDSGGSTILLDDKYADSPHKWRWKAEDAVFDIDRNRLDAYIVVKEKDVSGKR